MHVASMMSSPVRTARTTANVADVVRLMSEHRISAVPVVDEQSQLVGVVSVADLVPQARNAPASNIQIFALCGDYVDHSSLGPAYERLGMLPVTEVMNEVVLTVSPHDEAVVAARLMAGHRVGAIAVVGDDGQLVGIVTRTDLARLSLQPGRHR